MGGSVAIFVFDGYADWEPAVALAHLRDDFGFTVTSYGPTTDPVVSMGGLKILPDAALADFEPGAHRLLILPGGDYWKDGERKAITAVLKRTQAAGTPIAAICAATAAPAFAGLLDDRAHTSNRPGFLIETAGAAYGGQAYYRDDAAAVSDRGVITAPGEAPVAFAAAIIRHLVPERAQEVKTLRESYAREHRR
jgi:putative intracellular protease/amidase